MKRFGVIALAVLLIAGMLSFAGCKAAKSATEATWSITIQDASGKSSEFTNEDAGKLDMVDITAVKEKKDGSKTEENWSGVLLKDVLENADISGYSMVTVEASDGYGKDIDAATADDPGTILGFLKDGEEVSVDDGLVQLVVSTMPGSHWIKNVAVIKVSE